MSSILYCYFIIEILSFLYYFYEYVKNILPNKNNNFTIEEQRNVISNISGLNKDELLYVLRECIGYDKTTHDDYNRDKFNINDLSKKEIIKIIKYSILNSDDDIYVNDMLEYIENKCDVKFKNNKKDRYICSRWGMNFINFHYRFLIFNILIKIVVNVFHYYMLFLKKYEFYKCNKSNISYLYKNNNKKENVLFIHGFGIGYIPYIKKINYICEQYNIIILIIPNISGYYYGMMPNKEIISNSVNNFMNLKNIKEYNILAHSFGTYISQLICQYDIENKIKKIIYIDPIIFWLSFYKMCDFNIKTKYLENKTYNTYLFDILIFYIVNSDIYINNICFREMKAFDFLITEPSKNSLYVIGKKDYLIEARVLYNKYKDFKNIIFLENTEHGDVFLSSQYNNFLKEILVFFN